MFTEHSRKKLQNIFLNFFNFQIKLSTLNSNRLVYHLRTLFSLQNFYAYATKNSNKFSIRKTKFKV